MRFCSLVLLLVVLGTGIAAAEARLGATANEDSRPVYAAELEFLSPEIGKTLKIIGRFNSWMGKSVAIEGTKSIFEIGSDTVAQTLREPQSRDQELIWTVKLVGDEPVLKFSVLAAVRTRSPQELYTETRRTLSRLPSQRRLAVVNWALQRAQELADVELAETARKDLLAALAEQANGFGASGSSGDTSWLVVGEETLAGDSDWVAIVTEFAQKHESNEGVRSAVKKLGYTRDWNVWRREKEYLEEIGMLRAPNGAIITRERALLMASVNDWNGDDNAVLMLRRFTNQQYQEFSRKRQAAKGMNRIELVIGWGYPTTVTLLNRGDRRYEGWFYADRFACFVDGNLFEFKRRP